MLLALLLTLAASAIEAAEPSYEDARDVVEARCTSCHRTGGPAPFSLESYEQTRSWSKAIRREISAGRMPPWHADPRYGTFSNDRALKASEREVLLAWIEAGAPGPAPAARSAGSPPAASASTPKGPWSIGEPDFVFELPRDVAIPAQGSVPYHDYRIETNFEEDVWIRAAETQPGNPEVVHHIIVQALTPRGRLQPGQDARTAGDLGGYAPGSGPLQLPSGVARRVPAGAVLEFQMHYTPNGTPTTDRSRIGLLLSAEPPRHEAKTALCSTPFLWIPAGERSLEVEARHQFEAPVHLLSLRPHLHLRGDTFEFKAVRPDGSEEILLLVRDYDFNWQTTYRLESAVHLPARTEIVCTATYDNSTQNRDNPDPLSDVSWGRETTDEMMIGFIEYYVDTADGRPRSTLEAGSPP